MFYCLVLYNWLMEKQTRYIIISLIVLVLIVGGVFYFQKKYKSAILEKSNTEIPTNNDNLDAQTQGSTQGMTASDPNGDFNKAMKNAQIAFGKGEYDKSITYYNEALSYIKTDKVYSGLFLVYSAQNNIDKARIVIDSAIKLNPSYVDYWKWKLSLLDEKTEVSFLDLKGIYEEGLLKVDAKTKINLITHFAGIAERNSQKTEAVAIWEYAKQVNPTKKAVYQTEIDRLVNNY